MTPTWDKIAWYSALAACVGLELLGVFDGKFTTLTDMLRRWIPLWGRAMIVGWLGWHFLIAPDNWIALLKK